MTIKYNLDESQINEIIEPTFLTISNYYEKLEEEHGSESEELALYKKIFASIMLDKLKKTQEDAIELAKEAIFEYYSTQELVDEGYISLKSNLPNDIQEQIDDDNYDDITDEHYDWEEDNLLAYIVDNNYNDSSYSLIYLEIDSEYFYLDKAEIRTAEDNIVKLAIEAYEQEQGIGHTDHKFVATFEVVETKTTKYKLEFTARDDQGKERFEELTKDGLDYSLKSRATIISENEETNVSLQDLTDKTEATNRQAQSVFNDILDRIKEGSLPNDVLANILKNIDEEINK